MTLTTALTCPHGCGPKVPCPQCDDRPSPVWVRMIFKPFFKASGFWYHRRSGVWLDRSWDEIPEFVVRAGLLIYTVVFIPGVLLLIACLTGMLGEWLGWWPGSSGEGL